MTVLSPPWLPHPSPPSSSLHFPFAHQHQCKPGYNCNLARSDTDSVPLYVSVPLKRKLYIHLYFNVKEEVEKMEPDAGKHLLHQLLCSDTGLLNTLPNKDHRPESSATDRPRTKPDRQLDKSALEVTNKGENEKEKEKKELLLVSARSARCCR